MKWVKFGTTFTYAYKKYIVYDLDAGEVVASFDCDGVWRDGNRKTLNNVVYIIPEPLPELNLVELEVIQNEWC